MEFYYYSPYVTFVFFLYFGGVTSGGSNARYPIGPSRRAGVQAQATRESQGEGAPPYGASPPTSPGNRTPPHPHWKIKD